jgi:hypothetical protein
LSSRITIMNISTFWTSIPSIGGPEHWKNVLANSSDDLEEGCNTFFCVSTIPSLVTFLLVNPYELYQENQKVI